MEFMKFFTPSNNVPRGYDVSDFSYVGGGYLEEALAERASRDIYAPFDRTYHINSYTDFDVNPEVESGSVLLQDLKHHFDFSPDSVVDEENKEEEDGEEDVSRDVTDTNSDPIVDKKK